MNLIAALLIASASSFDTAAPAAPAASGKWYGWQTLLADAAAVAAGYGASTVQSESFEGKTLTTLTLGLGELGGPAIHLLHRQEKVAAKDL
jgi:hypothetical protein